MTKRDQYKAPAPDAPPAQEQRRHQQARVDRQAEQARSADAVPDGDNVALLERAVSRIDALNLIAFSDDLCPVHGPAWFVACRAVQQINAGKSEEPLECGCLDYEDCDMPDSDPGPEPPGPYREVLERLIARVPGAIICPHDGIPIALAEVPCDDHDHNVSLCTSDDIDSVEVTMSVPPALVYPVLRAAGVKVSGG